MASKRQKPAASRRSKKPVVTASVSEAPAEKFEASTAKPVEAVIVDGPDTTVKERKTKRTSKAKANKKKKSTAKQSAQKDVASSKGKKDEGQKNKVKSAKQSTKNTTPDEVATAQSQDQTASKSITAVERQTVVDFVNSRVFACLALILAGLGFIFAWLFGIGLLFALPAVALGFFALRVQPLGRHLSIAAIILGSIATISSAVFVIVWAIHMASVDDASSEWLDMGGAHAEAPNTPAQRTYSPDERQQ